MRPSCKALIALGVVISSGYAARAADIPGSRDYPGLGRVDDYRISDYEERRFGVMTFTLDGDRKVRVEGHTVIITYTANSELNHASALEIFRDYQVVLKNLGGTILKAPQDETSGTLLERFSQGGTPVFVEVVPTINSYGVATGGGYRLRIVEEKEFVPTMQR